MQFLGKVIRFPPVFLLFFCLLIFNHSPAQCISSYPYTEGFETSAGGWSSAGTNNDWILGTPSKPVITGAGGGTKCWITGGLTTSFYSYSEQSYVVSPCFDFSSLTYPHLSFKIFWEVEKKFDGGNLQYSTDGGITWENFGTYWDVTDCMNSNWYNNPDIKYLNIPPWIPVNEGWSGNTQSTSGSCQGGSGSGGWITAQHCMQALAGFSDVMFRFTFGTGSACNSYDGLAFDDVLIQNAPANLPSFNSICNGTAVSFSGGGTPCPTGFSWDFGDPSSGTANTSSMQNPTHVYTNPGIYTVTLTANGPCNPPGTISKTINILSANVSSQTNVSCFGVNDGSASVSANYGITPYTFAWSNGLDTQSATGLSPGNYSVTITDSSGCSATTSFSITQPQALNSSFSCVAPGCGLSDGSATITVNGGNPPYAFLWNNGQATQTATGLAAGSYTVTISDSSDCTLSSTVLLNDTNAPVISTASTDPSCNNGNNGIATASVTGGISPYSFLWSSNANNQATSTATGLTPGIYYVTVTDANGCTTIAGDTLNNPPPLPVTISGNDTVCAGESTVLSASGGSAYLWVTGDTTSSITANPATSMAYYVAVTTPCGQISDSINVVVQPEVIAFAGNDTTIIAGTTLQLMASGGSSYQWSTGENSNAIVVAPAQSATYSVTVTDANGCTEVATIDISVTEPEKYYISVPTIFSPNNDGKNDHIYVHGSGIKEFKLIIYDRWGEKIFEIKDKSNGWDGTKKGKPLNSGVFVYYLEATFNDAGTFKEKGNITLIR